MLTLTNNQKIHYTLRVAAAMCFIGHGAFGIITKPIWCNYFALVWNRQDHGISTDARRGHRSISCLGLSSYSNPSAPLQSGWFSGESLRPSAVRFPANLLLNSLKGQEILVPRFAFLLLAGGIQFNFPWLFSTINPNEPVR